MLITSQSVKFECNLLKTRTVRDPNGESAVTNPVEGMFSKGKKKDYQKIKEKFGGTHHLQKQFSSIIKIQTTLRIKKRFQASSDSMSD
jgi:hypothetical protein